MYNNHHANHQGIYTIRGDMGYDNKLMLETAAPPGRQAPEQVQVSIDDAATNVAERHPHPFRPHHPQRKGARKWRGRCSDRRRLLPIWPIVDVIIFLIVVAIMGVVELGVVRTPLAGYYCRDPSLSHPYTGDTISAVTLLVVSFLLPLAVVGGIELTTQGAETRRVLLKRLWRWYRDSALGICLVLLVVEMGKVVVGEHRPHFLATCEPDTEASCRPGSFVEHFRCTRPASYLLTDSSRSFPSGHSAVSVFVSVYLAGYLHYKLVGRSCGVVLKPLLQTLCLLWGVACSLSRVADRRHHWWDVLSGATVGVAFALYYVIAVSERFRTSPKSVANSASTRALFAATPSQPSRVV